MKAIFLFLLLSVQAYPQATSGSLYTKGFLACFEKAIADQQESKKRESLIASYDEDLIRFLPRQLGEIQVEYLSDWELAKRYKELPKAERERGINVTKIFPLYDVDGKLIFAVNFYWFRYSEKGGFFSPKRADFKWALEGGCHADFRFNPGQNSFVVEKVEHSGI